MHVGMGVGITHPTCSKVARHCAIIGALGFIYCCKEWMKNIRWNQLAPPQTRITKCTLSQLKPSDAYNASDRTIQCISNWHSPKCCIWAARIKGWASQCIKEWPRVHILRALNDTLFRLSMQQNWPRDRKHRDVGVCIDLPAYALMFEKFYCSCILDLLHKSEEKKIATKI